MPFFKSSNQKKLRRFFRKHGFEIIEGGNHVKAISKEGKVFVFPRHNKISNGVTREICKDLVKIGYTKAEIEKEILS